MLYALQCKLMRLNTQSPKCPNVQKPKIEERDTTQNERELYSAQSSHPRIPTYAREVEVVEAIVIFVWIEVFISDWAPTTMTDPKFVTN